MVPVDAVVLLRDVFSLVSLLVVLVLSLRAVVVCLRAAAGSGLAADLDLAGATLGLPVVGCVLSLLEAVDPAEAEIVHEKRIMMRKN